jgi:orotidine-5'-phosphate decarboxylase
VEHVADRLVAAVERTGSIACVGLDPRPGLLPPAIVADALERRGDNAGAVASAFAGFCQGVIDAVAGRCAAVKPQVACFEAYGGAGWQALARTVAHARARGVAVIVDGKRNDIGSTAEHYAQAMFGGAPGFDGRPLAADTGLGADWATVNGYLGVDGIAPFLRPGHGVFVLVRTSNPSAADLQDTGAADRMADLVARWGREHRGRSGLSAVGAVVGATWPQQAVGLRSRMPDTVFLVPGYGAQGASAADAVAGARAADGAGLLVNASRSILGAWQGSEAGDWREPVAAALEAMNAELAAARA